MVVIPHPRMRAPGAIIRTVVLEFWGTSNVGSARTFGPGGISNEVVTLREGFLQKQGQI
eukprot:COSAG02_NODE_269_length_26468_cov_4.489021_24_plen_58_part_01